jgi:hypothetical protein
MFIRDHLNGLRRNRGTLIGFVSGFKDMKIQILPKHLSTSAGVICVN